MGGIIMLLSVIIPVLNHWQLTADCLKSLREHTPGEDYEVIVVDNGSTDATARECPALGEQLFGERFRHLRFETNRNFAPACNSGARAASGDYLFLLNNDTLLTPDWLPPLIEEIRHDPKVGAVGPLLLYPQVGPFKDRVQHLGISFMPQLFPVHLHEYFPVSHPLVTKRRLYQALTGAALLVPAAIYRDVGGLHEAYRNGGEDVDFGLQLFAHGYRSQCVPQSRIYHLAGQTPGRHDHEKHNGKILKERCVSSIFPDWHYHVRSDGYRVGISPWLVPYPALPVARQRILSRQMAKGFDPDRCLHMLEREPYWMEGYDLLARYESERSNADTAMYVRFLANKMRPCLETALTLLQAAVHADNLTIADYAFRAVTYYKEGLSEKTAVATAKDMTNYIRTYDESLYRLYGQWLTEYERCGADYSRFSEMLEDDSVRTAGVSRTLDIRRPSRPRPAILREAAT